MNAVEILIIIATIILAIAGVLNVGMILYLNWASLRFTYVRILQTTGHFFGAVMVFFRIPVVLAGESPVIVWVGSAASIADFLYIWVSNLYYIELLKAIALKSKVFTERKIFYLQILTTVVLFGGYGSTLLRFTVYVDSTTTSWVRGVTLIDVVVVCESFRTNLCFTPGILCGYLCFARILESIELECIQNGRARA
jgi:hypothetical protein